MVEHLDRFTRKDRPGEQHRGHVRPSPRPIHREEAQTGGRQPVQVAVGVGHQLIGFLAGGIQAHRVVDRLALVKGQVAVAAIHRTAGGIHQVTNVVVTAAFQDVAKPHQIALDVGRRVLQRVTHPCLGSQIHHHIRTLLGKQSRQRIAVLKRDRLEPPGSFRGHGLDLTQTRLFEGRVVVAVEVVETDHALAAGQQSLRERCTDEAGGTGDQNRACHQPSPSPTRHRVKPAVLTASGSATARASNSQAGLRIRPASSAQSNCL